MGSLMRRLQAESLPSGTPLEQPWAFWAIPGGDTHLSWGKLKTEALTSAALFCLGPPSTLGSHVFLTLKGPKPH